MFLFYLLVRYSLILISCAYIQGGVDARDVLPSELNAMFLIHLGSTTDHKAFQNIIDKECKKVGIKYFFEQKDDQNETTKLERSNIFWRAFNDICSAIGVELDIKMRPTSSDSRFLRKVNLLFVQEFFI